jgi:hypothetical protein
VFKDLEGQEAQEEAEPSWLFKDREDQEEEEGHPLGAIQ